MRKVLFVGAFSNNAAVCCFCSKYVTGLSCVEVVGGGAAVRLPWGAVRERVAFPESIHINVNNKPGAFVLEMLFAEFTVLAEKKIEQALDSQVYKRHRTICG